jgi:hypothetical protein
MSLPILTFEAEFQPYISQQGAPDLPQANWTGKGYGRFTPTAAEKLTDPSLAAGTALPPDARHAFLSVKGGGIRVRTDGTDPTATEGLYIPAGSLMTFRNQRQTLLQWRMIQASGEIAEVTAMWFS